MKISIARLREIIMEEVARATAIEAVEIQEEETEPVEETIEIVEDE